MSLFLYAGGRAAFESPLPQNSDGRRSNNNNNKADLSSPNKCILLGGLSDGLLPVPYTQHLADICQQHEWSLVQPIISSSYLGFGHGSLQRDCDELQELVRYLITYRNGKEFAFVGHSTGCQDAVYFLKHADEELRSKFRLVALQAPVSDREGAEKQKGFAQKLEHAQALVKEGKGQEMLPRSSHWAPITAQRFVDLSERGGADDFFSSDFTDADLAERLGHVGTHDNLNMLVAFSGSDEYVPSHVDSVSLTDRMVEAMNTKCVNGKPVAESVYIKTGNHNLSEGPDDSKMFVDRISEIFERIKN
ncbi:MAG: hypothetical protein SGILL_005713 [Bacillariaceae sp.]